MALFAGCLLGVILAIVAYREHNSSSTGLPPDKIQSFTIVLKEDSFLSGKGKRIMKGTLETVHGVNEVECSASGLVLLIGPGEMMPLYQGELVSVDSQLNIMSDSKELNYISFVKGNPERKGWSSSVFQGRKNLIIRVEKFTSGMSESSSALFSALFTGNSDRLNGNLKDKFRESGVPHLLALSGFHVAIIVLVLTFLIQKIIGKTVAVLLCIPCLLFYLFFAGTSPSLVRAVIMFITGGVLLFFHKESDIMQILMITCLFQLLFSPIQGFSLSFQLSYMALIGILIIGKRINSFLLPWLPLFLRGAISASVGAHLLTAPILIYHFGALYPSGIIASIIITPLITIFMWISLLIFILTLSSAPLLVINQFNRLCDVLFSAIEKTVTAFSGISSVRFSGRGEIIVYLSLSSIIVLCLYIQLWRSYGRRKSSQFKLRFPFGNKSSAGDYGIGSEKKMEPEFSH